MPGIPINIIRGPSGRGIRPFIVSQALGTIRSDNSSDVGFAFTPNKPITVTALGRWIVSGNSQTHTVALRNAGGVLGSVSLNTTLGVGGSYFYVALGSPIVLSAGTQYFVVSFESGPDQWYSSDTTVVSSPDGTVNGSSFSHILWVAGLISYVPPNFLYHL